MASVALALSFNGSNSQAQAEEEELYTRLLQLRDDIVAGKSDKFKLSPAAIDRLRAFLFDPDAQSPAAQQASLNSSVNDAAFAANQYQHDPRPTTKALGAPFVSASNPSAQVFDTPSSNGLHPIFLEKSDVVIRAESQLKRQRLDRDLQVQVEQRKNSSRDKEPGLEPASPVDVAVILSRALELVKPFSGLKEVDEAGDDGSFDENDYYSSQVQSDWSSEARASIGSDQAAGAFTADFEHLDGPTKPDAAGSSKQAAHRLPPPRARRQSRDAAHSSSNDVEDLNEMGDEDDEYTPPDAAAFTSFREDNANSDAGHLTSPDDDNSDYEPGEISDSNTYTPREQLPQGSPHVPVIRNHLTHIVAPQPNRVSPLATAKGPSYELELVNGRPEMVQKKQQKQKIVPSRASTGSPPGNGLGSLTKKQRQKKRKRAPEPPVTGRSKRRKDKQVALSSSQTYVKDEPISPLPFAGFRNVPPSGQSQVQQQHPISIDLSSPRYVAPQQQAAHHPGSGFQYANVPPQPPAPASIASPSMPRQVQRDTQDLRRIASMQYAQRQPSPQRNVFSPVAPYRTTSANYGEPNPRLMEEHAFHQRAAEQPGYNSMQYHAAAAATAGFQPQFEMPPPEATRAKVFVDQHGNCYYPSDTAPIADPRSNVAPAESMPPPASTRKLVAPDVDWPPRGRPLTRNADHELSADPRVSQHQQTERSRLLEPFPEPPWRREDNEEQSKGNRLLEPFPEPPWNRGANEQQSHPVANAANRYAENIHYAGYAPTLPYEQMSLPPQQRLVSTRAAEPVYNQSRSYSVLPAQTQPNYMRHASVAPIQYAPQNAAPPAIRAASVMPGVDYGPRSSVLGLKMPAPPPWHGPQTAAPQATGNVRYLDQYGNEVFPSEVREVRY